MDQTVEESESNNNTFNQTIKHFTFRVAWHDNLWNGTVCKNPSSNIYCNGYHSLLSDRIRREKEKLIDIEEKYAGQAVTKMLKDTRQIPPCFWSVNVFGNDEIPVKHFNPAARHLTPIDEILPGKSMFSWPFAFSFVRSNEEYKLPGKYPSNLENIRAPKFVSKIKKESSIGFIYAK